MGKGVAKSCRTHVGGLGDDRELNFIQLALGWSVLGLVPLTQQLHWVEFAVHLYLVCCILGGSLVAANCSPLRGSQHMWFVRTRLCRGLSLCSHCLLGVEAGVVKCREFMEIQAGSVGVIVCLVWGDARPLQMFGLH